LQISNLMEEIIAGSILILSGIGLIFLFLKKIPVLVSLPEEEFESFTKRVFRKTKERIIEIRIFKRTFWDLLLEKNLRKIRILSLKIDSSIFNWLKKRKEKEIEEREREENYWDKIRKDINKPV